MKNLSLCLLLGTACQGPPGAAGVNGRDGADGAMGATGLAGSASAKGDPGAPGTMGIQGAPGARGDIGPQGPAGASLAATLQAVLDKVIPKKSAILNVWCQQPCPAGADPATCTNGKQWDRGTGTKLSDGTVLTANHVVTGATECQMEDADRTIVGKTSTFGQPTAGRDLAILKSVAWTSAGSALPSFTAKAYTPHLGELVLCASYPGSLNRDLQTTFGYITDTEIAGIPEWSRAIGVDYGAWSGSSGAPVFDSTGELVGIHVGLPDGRVNDIKAFLPIL